MSIKPEKTITYMIATGELGRPLFLQVYNEIDPRKSYFGRSKARAIHFYSEEDADRVREHLQKYLKGDKLRTVSATKVLNVSF